MLSKFIFASILALCALCINPIVSNGNAFFVKESNSRFYIRGVDYQPGGSSKLSDPLADTDSCERDVKYFKDLGINTVRVYSVDNTKNHDNCMKILADAGIYVIIDVNIPHASIARDEPECSYNTRYLEQVFASVLQFSKYDNTLGFFAGNEVVNEDVTYPAAYVKAVVRDIKKFLKKRNLRKVLVGYSAADVEQNRLQTAHYFNCGDDADARVDMFGFNDYSWCGESSYTTSGYDQKVDEYSNYSIPLFLSEYGCNEVSPRPFTEVNAIYSSKMTKVFSGGLVYEYVEEASNYGLVNVKGSSVSTNKDYSNLKEEFKKNPNPSGDGGYQKNLKYSNCPPKTDSWNVTSSIPKTPKKAMQYINGDREPKARGFKASTQWACSIEGTSADDDGDESSSSNSSFSSSRSSTSSSETGGSHSTTSSGSSSSSSSKPKKSEGSQSSAPYFALIISFIAGPFLSL